MLWAEDPIRNIGKPDMVPLNTTENSLPGKGANIQIMDRTEWRKQMTHEILQNATILKLG